MSAAAAVAIANAIRASGVVVRMEPEEFLKLLAKSEKPLVIWATGGIFSTNYQYLTSYKGFAFFTRSPGPFQLSANIETIRVNKIWTPG